MPRQPGYPATRYQPTALVDLSVRSERERLSPAALRAFFNIMTRWQVRDEDARALLGGVSNGPFYEMKKNPERVLDPDRLLRLSYVIGIFKALNLLYSSTLADALDGPAELQRNLRRPNAARIPRRRRAAGDAGRPPVARCPPRRLTRRLRLIRAARYASARPVAISRA